MPSLKLKTQRLHQPATAAKRILLVDDDRNILSVFSEFLKQAGYSVDPADDGDVGIKKYLQQQHDLIITDLFMPRVPGYEMIQSIKEGFPDARIVAISGGAPRGKTAYNLNAVEDLGITASLRKPVTREQLLKTVADALH